MSNEPDRNSINWNEPVDVTEEPDAVKVVHKVGDPDYPKVEPVWDEKPYTTLDDLTRDLAREEKVYASPKEYADELRRDAAIVDDFDEARTARLNTPQQVRANALKRASDLATSASRAMEASLEWMEIVKPDLMLEYTGMADDLIAYRDRLKKLYEG